MWLLSMASYMGTPALFDETIVLYDTILTALNTVQTTSRYYNISLMWTRNNESI